ncbi:MAG: PAS domain S-box protein, partial [Candidatus Omnitrophica bacterium]|nr:PAS domain S-box protein [Candidatus Omnitrophota bacterium]
TPFRDPTGKFIGIVEDFKDITIRKKAEIALKQSEEKLNAMLSSINDYMIMIDKGFNITWANDVAKNTFGQNIVGEKCYMVFFERTACCDNQPCFVAQAFADSKPHENDFEITTKEGKTLYFHCTANVALRDKEGEPTGILVIARDITESKKLERQLLQAQKMEAIGQLAGGIAHDFNNILTAIVGYGHLLQAELEPNSNKELHDYVDYILKASKRAANLTHALLAFSRTQIINTKPVNINDIIIVLEKLLVRLIGEDIELITNLSEEELIVMADTTQIEQVLMNLALVEQRTKNFEGAENYFLESVAVGKNNREVLKAIGNFYLETGKPEKAIFYLNRASILFPEDSEIHQLLDKTGERLKEENAK